ncbi:MAG: hypothetical protein F6K17_12150 [Okeania sp. SIO3C4]|nr:hypothetical protein [Okeania sp. SIO3B3]NER03309.1 hypothetical protein [Okeania sp. SIO3C4]
MLHQLRRQKAEGRRQKAEGRRERKVQRESRRMFSLPKNCGLKPPLLRG